jgi:hypothetical protein
MSRLKLAAMRWRASANEEKRRKNGEGSVILSDRRRTT